MLQITFSIILGAVIGILFSRYVFGTPARTAETFGEFLKRCGLSGSFAIGGPILAYLALYEQFNKMNVCLMLYFLSCFITAVLATGYTAWLAISSLPTESVPPEVIKQYRKRLLLSFYFGGYPAIKSKLDSIEECVARCEKSDFFYEQRNQNISEEDRRICEELKITPEDLKQICDATRRYFRK